ncbi:MAG: type II toxin-antitoxin system RatA family toxin [Gammaproteobacteria bacterium]|nr:type II toxin-antitoxin system RatA family toxin [Gammaproteobacteria bacterium]
MAVVKKSALVMYSARQMFNLVNDVESYPEFLPWCSSTTLLSRSEDKVCAELEVSRLGVSQKFSTCNRMVSGESMNIELVEGPFKHLKGDWVFKALREDACKVELELDFDFSGKLINAAFGTVFHQVANTLVDAFCKRAEEVYGSE